MNYDLKKTLKENLESVRKTIVEQEDNDEYKKEFDEKFLIVPIPALVQKALIGDVSDAIESAAINLIPGAGIVQAGMLVNSLNPDRATLVIPRTNYIDFWQEGDNPQKTFFGSWFGTQAEEYIPDKESFNNKFPPGTLRYFRTPDGKIFKISLKRDTSSKKPNSWDFLWYFDENDKPYIQGDYVKMKIPEVYSPLKTYWDKFCNYLEENWEELLWIALAIVVGVLTGGIMDVFFAGLAATEVFTVLGVQVTWRAIAVYLAEAGVWTTKGIINIANGHTNAGITDFVFGFLLPAVHGLGINRWGLKITQSEALALEAKLVGKTEQEVSELLTKSVVNGGLTNGEKAAFKQIVTLPPKAIEEQTVAVIRDINNKLIAAGKNPISLAERSGLIAKGRFNQLGSFLKKRWFTRLPTYLVHDMGFLWAFDKLCQSLNICDDPSEEFLKEMINQYDNLSPEEKKEFDQNIDLLIQDSTTGKDLKTLGEERGIFNFGDTSSWNPKWDTIQLKKDFGIE